LRHVCVWYRRTPRWHNMFLFAAGPAVLQGALMTVVPESPG
jgi:hypothetical protein